MPSGGALTSYVNHSAIIVSGRQREEFNPDWLADLAESIRAVGLLHPIVLRNGHTLVAGERRLRACQSIFAIGERIRFGDQWAPVDEVPCVDLGELSPAEAYRAELDENIRRADLTWQERAAATLRLAEMVGGDATGLSNVGEVSTLESRAETHRAAKALAPELAGTPGVRADISRATNTIFQRIQLAKAIAGGNSAVAGAKSEADGLKLLRRGHVAAENLERARQHGGTDASSRFRAYNADARDWCIEALSMGETFDILITDPPYGMEADSFGDAAGKLVAIEHDYRDGEEAFAASLEILTLATKLMRDDAHAYVYCDIDNFVKLREHMALIGWRPHRTPLVHLKRQGGRVPWPLQGPRRAYELVCYAVRGGKPVTGIIPDVFDTSLTEGNLGHGAQKPVEAYLNLLGRSARPGDRILDPFAGTGTVFAAAHALKLLAVGVERNPETFGITLKRIADLK